MSNIFSSKPEAFGLDISDLSLKIAKLEKTKDFLKLASFGETEIPPGVIEGGEIKDEKSLGEIIKKSLSEVKGKKLKAKYVIASLPEEKSFLDIIQIPLMKKEEMEEALRFEAENHIPIPLDEVYFDFEKIETIFNHSRYQEVLIAACPKKVIDAYLRALKGAGLFPLALEVESLSIVRALVKKEKVFPPLLIIDFGGTRTSFIIYSGRSLRFTSTIPISSQGLTKTIAKNLNVSLKKAEFLKLKYGLEGKKKIFEAMIPPLTDLVEQIKTLLRYYQSHESGEQIFHNGKEMSKILLCGGGANLKGLVEFLSQELKVEVELGNPWVNILKEPIKEIPELPFEKSLAYTTALGLALRGIYGY
jgi:type IV pilus assembly protein PilM